MRITSLKNNDKYSNDTETSQFPVDDDAPSIP